MGGKRESEEDLIGYDWLSLDRSGVVWRKKREVKGSEEWNRSLLLDAPFYDCRILSLIAF